jgi:threonine dehydratase
MGSGIAGLITVRDLLGLQTEIIGVGMAKAPATVLSFSAGRPVNTATAHTFADGMATREPNADAVAIICGGAARMVELSEDAVADAMRVYFDATHQIAEGAGAAPLAALMQERDRMANKNVAVVLSGGNIERARFLQVLGGATPAA